MKNYTVELVDDPGNDPTRCYFKLIQIKESKTLLKKNCVCPKCFTTFSRLDRLGCLTGSSTFKRHLDSCLRTESLPKITKFCSLVKKKSDLNRNDLLKLKKFETLFVIQNYHAFSIVDEPALMNLFQLGIEFGEKYGNIDVSNFWCGRKAITNNADSMVNEAIKKMTEKLEKNIKSCSISLSTDIWSDSVNKVSYIDVTAAFVDSDFEVKHFCLRFQHFPNSHTAENIFASVKSICKNFNIQIQACPITTDGAANMKKACEHNERYTCFCHHLHTCFLDGFNAFKSSDIEVQALFNDML